MIGLQIIYKNIKHRTLQAWTRSTKIAGVSRFRSLFAASQRTAPTIPLESKFLFCSSPLYKPTHNSRQAAVQRPPLHSAQQSRLQILSSKNVLLTKNTKRCRILFQNSRSNNDFRQRVAQRSKLRRNKCPSKVSEHAYHITSQMPQNEQRITNLGSQFSQYCKFKRAEPRSYDGQKPNTKSDDRYLLSQRENKYERFAKNCEQNTLFKVVRLRPTDQHNGVQNNVESIAEQIICESVEMRDNNLSSMFPQAQLQPPPSHKP